MIETVYGDVLDVPTGIIVHGCNTHGVMGAGIALQIKNRFPIAYQVYRDVYEGKYDSPSCKGLVLGDISLAVVNTSQVGDVSVPEKIIINAVTQGLGGPGRQVRYDAVADCFERVAKIVEYIDAEFGVKMPVLFPAIGAGLGGGSWNVISAIIDESIPDTYVKRLYLLK